MKSKLEECSKESKGNDSTVREVKEILIQRVK